MQLPALYTDIIHSQHVWCMSSSRRDSSISWLHSKERDKQCIMKCLVQTVMQYYPPPVLLTHILQAGKERRLERAIYHGLCTVSTMQSSIHGFYRALSMVSTELYPWFLQSSMHGFYRALSMVSTELYISMISTDLYAWFLQSSIHGFYRALYIHDFYRPLCMVSTELYPWFLQSSIHDFYRPLSMVSTELYPWFLQTSMHGFYRAARMVSLYAAGS